MLKSAIPFSKPSFDSPYAALQIKNFQLEPLNYFGYKNTQQTYLLLRKLKIKR